MAIHIHPAQVEDLPGIVTIFNDAILNTTTIYSYEPVTLAAQQQWLAAKQAQGFPVFVAKAETQVVGFGAYGSFRPWPAFGHTVENSVYVHPAHRRRGIGRQLLAALIDQARQQEYHAMVAGIDASNPASLALHQAFGFQQVGYLREVGFKFDRWLDLVFMELLLGC